VNRRGEGDDAKDGWRTFAEMRSILDQGDSGTNPFVGTCEGGIGEVRWEEVHAVCHMVIPEVNDGKMAYRARRGCSHHGWSC